MLQFSMVYISAYTLLFKLENSFDCSKKKKKKNNER